MSPYPDALVNTIYTFGGYNEAVQAGQGIAARLTR